MNQACSGGGIVQASELPYTPGPTSARAEIGPCSRAGRAKRS